MKPLNQYTREQLLTLYNAIQVTIVTCGEQKVESKVDRELKFWKGEVKMAIDDATFEEKVLPFK